MPDKQPNIIFILLDNFGWGDLACYGGMIPTPRIDELASEGIRFKNYNVECQCTPTRTSIMTGRHPVRCGTLSVPWPGQGPSGLCPWEYTTAELLSDAGYATASYGKWHLGNVDGRLPNDQGFDEWWGIKNTWDEAGYTEWPLFEKSGIPAPMIWEGKKGEKSTEVMPLTLESRKGIDEKHFVPKTIDFIKKNAATNKPFFIYYSYSELHPPEVPNPNYAGKAAVAGGPHNSGEFADIVAELDDHVGEIMDAVKEAGIDDNTIVILSSDNANGAFSPNFPGSNGPFKGDFFFTPWEGSHRVPAIIRWPGAVPAGVVTNEMLAAVDWLPTLAGMVGESNLVPEDRPIDGVDASAFMLGKSDTTGRDSYTYTFSDGKPMSVKWNHYKIIFRYVKDMPSAEAGIIEPPFPMVFDLSVDPHEDLNIGLSVGTVGWLMGVALAGLIKFEQSVAKYPNIKPGQEFEGYPAK
jgi:arylsulfatase A-like enzyme